MDGAVRLREGFSLRRRLKARAISTVVRRDFFDARTNPLEKPDDIATLLFDSIFRRNGGIAVQLLVEIERFLSRGLRARLISQASRQVCVTLQEIRSQ